MIRVELPHNPTVLAITTTLDCFEGTGWDDIHTKTLPCRILFDLARVLTSFQLKFGTIGDRPIATDFDGKALRRILVPMQLAVSMIHCELLVIRIVVCSTSIKFEYARIGIGILDSDAKWLVFTVLAFAIKEPLWELYTPWTFDWCGCWCCSTTALFPTCRAIVRCTIGTTIGP